MKRMKLLALVSVVLAVAGLELMAGVATPSTIIVLPARRRIVELASQIARIKDVGLVVYNSNLSPTEPLIHIWNGTEWLMISMADYTSGSFMSGEPKNLILLGDSTTLPGALAITPAWCPNVNRITSLETSVLLNEMNTTLKFSPRQWKWLAQLNGLVLTDKNVDRRRYGRWGAPGNEEAAVSAKPMPAGDIVMPPAPVQEQVKPLAKPEAPVVEPVIEAPVKADAIKEETKVIAPAAPVADKPSPPAVSSPETPANVTPAPAPADK
jgi:hypothetical protein